MNRSGDSETSQYLLMNGDRHFANVYLEVISSRIWHVLILDVDKHDICNRHHAGQRKSFESPTLISIVNDHKKWRFSHSWLFSVYRNEEIARIGVRFFLIVLDSQVRAGSPAAFLQISEHYGFSPVSEWSFARQNKCNTPPLTSCARCQ